MGGMLYISLTEVIVGAIAAFVIGALWYSPVLFLNAWLKELKISKKDMEKSKKKGMVTEMIIAFLKTLVFAAVLALAIKAFKPYTLLAYIQVGLMLWLGFIATTMLDPVLWEKKSLNLYLINVSQHLVSVVVMSIIFFYL